MFQNIRCTCAYGIFRVVIFGKTRCVLGTVCENLLLSRAADTITYSNNKCICTVTNSVYGPSTLLLVPSVGITTIGTGRAPLSTSVT